MMGELLQRMAEDPLGQLPATGLTEREDRMCDLLEDRGLAKWTGNYPYGYRITAAGYDELKKGEPGAAERPPRPPALARTSNGRGVRFVATAWLRPGGHIRLDVQGVKDPGIRVRVQDDPDSYAGHPTLYKHLARCLADVGAPSPLDPPAKA